MKPKTPAQTLADAARDLRKMIMHVVPIEMERAMGEEIDAFDEALKAYDEAAPEQGPEPAQEWQSAIAHEFNRWLGNEGVGECYEQCLDIVREHAPKCSQPPQPESKTVHCTFFAETENLLCIKHAHGMYTPEEAKPGDWMREAAKELIEAHLSKGGDDHRISRHEVEWVVSFFAKHAHCPNAAGDAREVDAPEVSAKELIAWVTKHKVNPSNSLRWKAIYEEDVESMQGYLDAMLEAERAKASQTP